jgi:hypothetical protein
MLANKAIVIRQINFFILFSPFQEVVFNCQSINKIKGSLDPYFSKPSVRGQSRKAGFPDCSGGFSDPHFLTVIARRTPPKAGDDEAISYFVNSNNFGIASPRLKSGTRNDEFNFVLSSRP